jgi:hypothetical protein
MMNPFETLLMVALAAGAALLVSALALTIRARRRIEVQTRMSPRSVGRGDDSTVIIHGSVVGRDSAGRLTDGSKRVSIHLDPNDETSIDHFIDTMEGSGSDDSAK